MITSYRFAARLVCVMMLLTCANGRSTAQESRIELHTISSASLGIGKSFNVFLPKDYDQSTERYPVLYLFRGHEKEWAEPNQDPSIQGMTAKKLVDTLIEKGLIGNLIVVMPGLSSSDNTVPGLAVNFLRVDLAGGTGGLGSGKFEDYMMNELIPYVDSHFRTFPTRWHRGVDGFSLGGFTSMLLATKHPTRFCSAGAYDGTLMWLDFIDQYQGGQDFWLWDPEFDPQFGSPRDVSYETQYNASNNVKNGSQSFIATLAQTQFLIHGAMQGGNNLNRNQHFVTILNSKGISNGFSELALSPAAAHNWYYAYLHMVKSLPLHWQKFQSAPNTLALHGVSPSGGIKVSGIVPVQWSHETRSDTLMTILEYSRDAGTSWHELHRIRGADTVYSWNTATVPDGTRYLVRATVFNDTSFGAATSLSRFSLDNPGNGAPDLALLSPIKNDVVTNIESVTWFAEDAEGSPLLISLEGSADGGLTWQSIASNLQNTGSYTWDSRAVANSHDYRIRISCTDGVNTVEKVSKAFAVQNQRALLADTLFHHVQGFGDGALHAHITNPALLTGHTYRIMFNDTSSATKKYSVIDLANNTRVVENATALDGFSEGPQFDGLRLVIADYPVAIPDTHATRWTTGGSNLVARTTIPQINTGNEPVNGIPYPADYQFTVSDHVVDTSSSYLDLPEIPMYFTVRNITENHKVKILYYELDNDHKLSRTDFVYILEKDKNGQPLLTWEVFFDDVGQSIRPAPGDVFLLKFLKPFTSGDRFEFTALTTGVVAGNDGALPRSFSLLQNYPNPFNPSTVIRYVLPRTAMVTLELFNILGQRVSQLVRGQENAGEHAFTLENPGLASGVYFYRLRAVPASGQAGEFVATKKLIILR